MQARQQFFAKLQAFVNACVELDHAFDDLQSDDQLAAVARDYPFPKAFEEMMADIFEWRDSLERNLKANEVERHE